MSSDAEEEAVIQHVCCKSTVTGTVFDFLIYDNMEREYCLFCSSLTVTTGKVNIDILEKR